MQSHEIPDKWAWDFENYEKIGWMDYVIILK